MLVFPMLVAVGGTTALTLLWAFLVHVHCFDLVENLAWLAMLLRKSYRPLSFYAKFPAKQGPRPPRPPAREISAA